MRFDWYSATIREEPGRLLEGLQEALEAEARPCRGMYGYLQGWTLDTPAGDAAATVWAGGRNRWPHAVATGDRTDAFVEVVRSRWGDCHSVSRMDAAEDFDEPGAWDRLYGAAVGLAEELNLKFTLAGDYLRAKDGRTAYIGSRNSPVMGRIYEKGKQLRGQMPGFDLGISEDWVRAELQVRPSTSEGKRRAAVISPQEAWGWAAWSGVLLQRIAAVEVPKVQDRVWRPSDDERAFRACLRQYGGLFERMVGDLGSWEALALQMRDELAELRRLARRGRLH